MRSLLRHTVTSIVLNVSLLALHTSAFDVEAYDAVGMTAESAMGQKAHKEAKWLLDGKDASDVVGLGRGVTEKAGTGDG